MLDKANLGITGRLKIYSNGSLIFDDKNAIIYKNLMSALGVGMAGSAGISSMHFGSGTGTIDATNLTAGLFTDEYQQSVRGAGAEYTYSIDGSTISMDFYITMLAEYGNGSGTVNYTECGLFDGGGNKLTHITFPPVKKNNTISLQFHYQLKIVYGSNVQYLGEQFVNAYIPMAAANDENILTGAQTFTRSSVATYIDPVTGLLTSATTDEERFENDSASTVRALIEGSSTNDALYSDDLTNAAWVKTNGTAALDATGPDGVTNSASSFTATSANATALQSITNPSEVRSYSVRIKRRTGTGTVEVTMDGGTSWTDITSSLSTSSWYHVELNQTVTNSQFGIRLTTSGDVVEVANNQNEAQPHKTSYIATTSSAQTRSDDILYISSSNLTNPSNGLTILCNASINNDGNIHTLFYADTGVNTFMVRDATGVLSGELGGVAFTTTTTPDELPHQYGLRTDGTNHDVLVDGVSVYSFTGTLAESYSNVYIGSNMGTTDFLNGYIGNFRIYPRYLTLAEINK